MILLKPCTIFPISINVPVIFTPFKDFFYKMNSWEPLVSALHLSHLIILFFITLIGGCSWGLYMPKGYYK